MNQAIDAANEKKSLAAAELNCPEPPRFRRPPKSASDFWRSSPARRFHRSQANAAHGPFDDRTRGCRGVGERSVNARALPSAIGTRLLRVTVWTSWRFEEWQRFDDALLPTQSGARRETHGSVVLRSVYSRSARRRHTFTGARTRASVRTRGGPM